MRRLVHGRRARDWLLQGAFTGALAAAVIAVTVVAVIEMRRKGVTSGFGFLWQSTGWDIGSSILSYSIRDTYGWALLAGLTNTIVIGYAAVFAASILGLMVAMARSAGSTVLRYVALVYIDIIRNVPPILQVFIWYALFTALPRPREAIILPGGIFLSARGIAMPTLALHPWANFAVLGIVLAAAVLVAWSVFSRRTVRWSTRAKVVLASGIGAIALAAIAGLVFGFRLSTAAVLDFPRVQGFGVSGGAQISPEASAIFFGIMVYGSAYIAEVIRAGFAAVPEGQIEAGRALGFSSWQIYRKIRLPLAFRFMLPALANQYVWLIKATTLGIAVGFADLFLVVSSSINQIGQPIELLGILIGAFWMMSHGTAWLSNKLNASLKLKA